ncbi:MAG: tRNA epoxyqueuosine(34) reductase QueG [Polyangiales bacterium]
MTRPHGTGKDVLGDALRALASELGFARVGFARAERLGPEADALARFLAEGRHGTMGWLAENVEVRVDPSHPGMLESALTVVVLAAPYAGRDDAAPTLAPARFARYARGRDYHNVLTKRARKLAAWLEAAGHRTRVAVDTKPVLERAWARRAGVGFVGKNCCLIVPGLGSHVFLACLVTAAELSPDEPMDDRCGSCVRCLEACPTRAFVGPRELDARRCISYLTIEHEGPIDEALRPGLEDWAFGCDACQDVCPYNRTRGSAGLDVGPFAEQERLRGVDAEAVLRMDEEAFRAFTEGSPLKRAGRVGLARNLAVVLGNRGGKRHLPVLRELEARDPDAAVRDAAAWALARIDARGDDEP